MKKSLLTVILLCSSLALTSAKNSTSSIEKKWFELSTRKFYHTRYFLFYQGLNELNSNNYASAEKFNRGSLTTTWKFNFGAYNNFGVAVGKLAKWDQAIGLFGKSIKSGGNPDNANFNIFITYMNWKKYKEAYRMLSDIPSYLKEIYPEEVGACYILNGYYSEGYDLLRQYIQTDSIKVSDATYYNAALAAWVVSDTVSAIDYIGKAIEKYRKNFNYHLLQGKILIGINPALAVGSFQRAYKLAPENIECRMELGHAYISNGEGKKAKSIFKDLIKDGHTKDADIYQGFAISLGQCSEMDDAIGAMNEVAKRRSLTPLDNRILGDLWLNKDSIDTANNFYDRILSQEFDPDAALGKTIIYFLKDKTDSAFDMIKLIETNSPQYKLSDYGIFLKAMIYYRMGLFTEFNEEIDHSFFGHTKESGKLMIMAMKSISQFQYGEANKFLKKALKLDPDNINLQLVYGTLNFQMGNFTEAAVVFKKAHQMDPNNTEIQNSLALTLSEIGEGTAAIEMMRNVLNKERKARYYNNMALVLFHVAKNKKESYNEVCGYYETGIKYVDSALAVGASPAFAINKGNLYYELHDTANAKKYFFDPSTPFSINNIAVMNFLDNKLSQAASHIEQAIELSGIHLCPIISYNKLIIKLGTEYSRSRYSEGPTFIYLYQVMPALLPSHHIFSYHFKMKNNSPIHIIGEYIIYTSLEGQTNINEQLGKNNANQKLASQN